jgi:Polysulphide reductase, NrfD
MSKDNHPDLGQRADEARLDALREEAARTGQVRASGAAILGGPIPLGAQALAENRAASRADAPGYYGRPVVKAPVWTWEIGLYFFAGGMAGMAAVLALAGLASGQSPLFVRDALALAAVGAVISPILLVTDLGRPARFLNMLRVFKWRSPMSVGVWTLLLFSMHAVSALLLFVRFDSLLRLNLGESFLRGILFAVVLGNAFWGLLLATYTGVLLGATAIPAWFSHHKLLPFHFGMVGLGSAAAVMELLGFRLSALNALGLLAAAAETGVLLWLECKRNGTVDRALRAGLSGTTVRAAGLLAGPVALLFRAADWRLAAGVCFLLGGMLARYGWLAAGRASAADPEATFASQRTRSVPA